MSIEDDIKALRNADGNAVEEWIQPARKALAEINRIASKEGEG